MGWWASLSGIATSTAVWLAKNLTQTMIAFIIESWASAHANLPIRARWIANADVALRATSRIRRWLLGLDQKWRRITIPT